MTAGASPPTLTPLKSLRVTEGSPARFETQVKGSPTPVVTWTRDDVVIEPSRDFQVCNFGAQVTAAEARYFLLCATDNTGRILMLFADQADVFGRCVSPYMQSKESTGRSESISRTHCCPQKQMISYFVESSSSLCSCLSLSGVKINESPA